MSQLPRIIASSVVRSARQGESHGGVYLVDLNSGETEQVIDWNDPGIDWEGRGGDRGLRGIAFYRDKVYLAGADEVFAYTRDFRLLQSYRNRYLKRCHEIDISGDTLYLTSTDLNSILEFDLVKGAFTCGYKIARVRGLTELLARGGLASRYSATPFDPNGDGGPQFTPESADLHINNVKHHAGRITISGTRIEALLSLLGESVREYAPLPRGTHNAAIYKGGLIYNDTASGRAVIADKLNRIKVSFAVPKFNPAELSHTDVPNDHARQGFARGLCLYRDQTVIAGSSPSTISAYDLPTGECVRQVNISKDIRNCVHGLEVWPEESG